MADAQDHSESEIPTDPLIPAETSELIDDPERLAALVEEVREAGIYAFDTEFIGEESYVPQLCLLQVSTPTRLVLVDPMDGLDVTALWELIADPEVRTLVHAGQQDLEPAVRLLGRPPANIIDTQIAAAFTGRPYPLSLRHLVEEFIGIRLGKAMTFTRWDKRPISRAHQRYAADDVRYLHAIWARMQVELEADGHLDRVFAECRELDAPERYRFDADARVTRLMASRRLDRRTIAALRAIVVLRDELARAGDVPPRSLLKDDVVVRIARAMPVDPAALDKLKGMPWPVVQAHGERIVAELAAVKALDSDALPPAGPPDESPRERSTIDALWSLVSSVAYAHGIDPTLVANRREMALWYRRHVAEDDAVRATGFDAGWRDELFGTPLRAMLAGTPWGGARWDGARLRPA